MPAISCKLHHLISPAGKRTARLRHQQSVPDHCADRSESDNAFARQQQIERLTQILLLSERTSLGHGIDPLPAGWIHSFLTSRPDGGGLGRWDVRQRCLRHRDRLIWPANSSCNCNCLLFHRCRGKTDGQALVQVALQESANPIQSFILRRVRQFVYQEAPLLPMIRTKVYSVAQSQAR